MLKHSGTVFRGTLLVAGTTIGGGMLAMPVDTAVAGFLPSLLLYILCWAVMTTTGLLFLEVCLWMQGETNIVSMAERTLGTAGKVCAWGLYLFLFYCLTLAYVVGGGNFVADTSGGVISDWLGSLLFIVVFGGLVWSGARTVGRLNVPLIFGLAIAYFGFVFLGVGDVKLDLLARCDWERAIHTLPIIFISFGFQGLVPTLTRYMGYDRKKTQSSILCGSLIALLTFLVWQGLILGIVPLEGTGGLLEARAAGYTAVKPLKQFIQNPFVYIVGQYFAFFALTTSFLGVTLGLLDFLADGLKIKKTPLGRFFLCSLIFAPPLLVAQVHPHVFLNALSLAGGYGVALLLGLLPIFMVWVGRYYRQIEGVRVVPGGRVTLLALALFIVFEVIVKATHTWTLTG